MMVLSRGLLKAKKGGSWAGQGGVADIISKTPRHPPPLPPALVACRLFDFNHIHQTRLLTWTVSWRQGRGGGASGRGCYHSKEPNLKSPNVKPKAKAVNSIFWISDVRPLILK